MYKAIQDIRKINLDTSLHKLHKKGLVKSDFGMDSSADLFDNSFGLYSTADLKKNIGPVKTEYFRISLTRGGSAHFDIGLEKYQAKRNSVLFGFPGQIFSLREPSDDFLAYYMLFTESFISDAIFFKNYRQQFPFLNYSGVPCFQLDDETAKEAETLIFKMNNEIKNKRVDCKQAIQLYIQLLLILANRCYGNLLLSRQGTCNNHENLFSRFTKLVSQHFLTYQKVSDYAELLHVSPDHLNRTIRLHSDKTAHELIGEMILIEAKAYLLHSRLSVAEIAYKLEFADPSSFNKFFKKLSGCTPLQFRSKSE